MRNRFWMPALVAMTMGGLTPATSVRPLSLEQLASGAESIVYGKVESVDSFWNAQRIESDVTIRCYESWKGTPSNTVVVRVPGGTVNGLTMRCSEAPVFHQADDVVCFLKSKGSVKEVYGWFRGQYTVVNQQVREIPNTSISQFRGTVVAVTMIPVTPITQEKK